MTTSNPIDSAAQITRIIESFNFEEVHRTMVATNWTWGHTYGPECVPAVETLRKQARELLESLSLQSWWIGTGGFVAFIDRNGDYMLHFSVDYASGVDRDAP